MSAVSSEHPPAPLSRAISGKSRLAAAGETTPLMLDVPGHFRDLPMFLDTAQRLRSGRWKAMVEAIVSKASRAHNNQRKLSLGESLGTFIRFA